MEDVRPDEERRFKIHFTRSDFFGQEDGAEAGTSKDAGLFLLAYRGTSRNVDLDRTFWCWGHTANSGCCIFSYPTKEKEGDSNTNAHESKAFRSTFSSNRLPDKADSVIVLRPEKGDGRLVRVFSRYSAREPINIGGSSSSVPPLFTPDKAESARAKRPQPHPEHEPQAIIVDSPLERPAQLQRLSLSSAASKPRQRPAASLPIPRDDVLPTQLQTRPQRRADLPSAPSKPIQFSESLSAAAAPPDEKKALLAPVESIEVAPMAMGVGGVAAANTTAPASSREVEKPITMRGAHVGPVFSSSEESNSEDD